LLLAVPIALQISLPQEVYSLKSFSPLILPPYSPKYAVSKVTEIFQQEFGHDAKVIMKNTFDISFLTSIT